MMMFESPCFTARRKAAFTLIQLPAGIAILAARVVATIETGLPAISQ